MSPSTEQGNHTRAEGPTSGAQTESHASTSQQNAPLQQPNSLSWAARRGFHGRLSPVIIDLLSQPDLHRLAHIGHDSAQFTAAGSHMTHSHLDHSLRAVEIGDKVAEHLKLNEHDRTLLACGCLLRNLKHPTFNEQPERSAGDHVGVPADNIPETLKVLRDPDHEIALTLTRNGVDPLEVADVLDPTSPRFRRFSFLANEIAHSLAFLEEQFVGSELPEHLKRLARGCTDQVIDHLTIRDGSVCFTRPEPVVLMLALRRTLDQEVSYSPSAVLAQDVLIEGI